MTEPTVAPFGAWRSPITPAMVSSAGVALSAVQADGVDLYWIEGRPLEGGRNVVVRRDPGGTPADITPEGMNARTTVHEYGGGAFTVHRGTVYFSNFADQRLYRQGPDSDPVPITPEPDLPTGLRYADGCVTPDGRRLYCVRETHFEDREPANEIVVLSTDGSEPPCAVASGHDFCSSPRVSADGRRLAWLTWDHPRMPWDGAELWTADIARDAGGSLTNVRLAAGGESESIFQPEWGPDGGLYFVSDRTGWWNLYRLDGGGEVRPLAPMEAEFGLPAWAFGLRTYGFLGDGRIAVSWSGSGIGHIGVLDAGTGGQPTPAETPHTSFGRGTIGELAVLAGGAGGRVATVAASPTDGPAVVTVDVDTGAVDVIRRAGDADVPPGCLSPPRAVSFPTGGGHEAHAFFYPPANAGYRGPEDARPPLIVISHGGPTGQSGGALALAIQFWTSRGFAVVDVNYRGSSGYGRAYRELLKGAWGVADTEDCINAARWLAGQGEVDGDRLVIRGGSAGGYTTLCALAFHDVFAAGASYYGVADPAALAEDTHKFESRYLDGLIGPYPEEKALYEARSPIHHTDGLSCPVILLQGLEDRVVPPAQAERMADALRERGVPFAYLAFEGEQHGFRRAENVQRALEAELYFYSRVFGFELADPVEPIEIENL